MMFRDLVVLGICMCCILACILAAGCVSAVRNQIDQLTATPVPTTPVPVITLESAKTIEPVQYIEPVELQKYRWGEKQLGEYYVWHRENVSGQKDMTVRVTVYAYKFLNRYQWWSDSNGRYYWQFPEDGKKYLFIFAYLEMVGEDDSQDPRYFVGEPWQRFLVQIGNGTIAPDNLTYVKSIRIHELEETFTRNDDARVKPFGYAWEWRRQTGTNQSAGWQAISPLWLRMGKSNAWDGYILFEVPKTTAAQELKVLSQWDTFGNPYWQLTEKKPITI